jgi:hypothetical protein
MWVCIAAMIVHFTCLFVFSWIAKNAPELTWHT